MRPLASAIITAGLVAAVTTVRASDGGERRGTSRYAAPGVGGDHVRAGGTLRLAYEQGYGEASRVQDRGRFRDDYSPHPYPYPYPTPDAYRHSGYRGYAPVVPDRAYAPPPADPYPYDGGRLPWVGDVNRFLTPDRYRYPDGHVQPPPYRPGFDPYPTPGVPAAGGGAISRLSEVLVVQAEAFLNAFAPQVRVVPQGELFMADASALYDAAVRLRQTALSGAPSEQVVLQFQDVALRWQRFEARMAAVSRGRIGPNIATALEMGKTVESLGRLMPVPGFAR